MGNKNEFRMGAQKGAEGFTGRTDTTVSRSKRGGNRRIPVVTPETPRAQGSGSVTEIPRTGTGNGRRGHARRE